MGLDMYFNRVSANGHKQALYLQKANQIHSWLLRRFEADEDYNCNDKPITLEKQDITDLLSDIQSVFNDRELAETVLPTMDGFYFGETDYDEFYFELLRRIYEEISKLEKETDWKNEWIEYSCWW